MGLLGEVTQDDVVKKDVQVKKQIEFVDSLVYASKSAAAELPEFEMAEESVPMETAYQLVHDELEVSPRGCSGADGWGLMDV